MVFFVFGVSTRRGIAPNEANLLQGHEACLLCGRAPVRVVQVQRTCHWCFIPLFPMTSDLTVVCTGCNVPVKLVCHVQQSSLRGNNSARSVGGIKASSIPVATMVGIIRDVETPSSSDEALGVTSNESGAFPEATAIERRDAKESEPLVEASARTIV